MYVQSTRTCVVMYLHICMHSRKQGFNRMYRVCYIWIVLARRSLPRRWAPQSRYFDNNIVFAGSDTGGEVGGLRRLGG